MQSNRAQDDWEAPQPAAATGLSSFPETATYLLDDVYQAPSGEHGTGWGRKRGRQETTLQVVSQLSALGSRLSALGSRLSVYGSRLDF